MKTKSYSQLITTISRYRGSLLGLAAGDALGTTLEFESPGTFTPITDMVGGGPFKLNPGEWTDDTSMALCLAESLIEEEKFDPIDQMQRYLKWYRDGHLSSNGKCFDIGITIGNALRKFEKTKDPYSGSEDPNSAGNGSLMRLAPIPLVYVNDEIVAMEKSVESSRTTHGSKNCVDACRYMTVLILGAVKGKSKETILNEIALPTLEIWNQRPLAPAIANIASGSYQQKEPPEIKGTGYVVKSLEAALWAFYKSENFEEGALMAVNLGNDADTTGAIYGQLAGAYYGEEGIPEAWKNKIAHRSLIVDYAERLFKLADRITV
jgi:ADP-ribosyl-[dinitrogen reductase] hydrolase